MTPHPAAPSIAVKKKSAEDREPRVAKSLPRTDELSGSSGPIFTLVVVGALLLIAFAIRVWGSRFGLPYLFHPDEQAIVERAITIMRTGDFNPHWFHYPSLFTYVQTGSDILVFLALAAKQIEDIALPTTATLEYVHYGRIATAAMGTITILIVYEAGRSLFSKRIGLLAAALLTFSLLHVIHSHYVTTDVPMTLFTTLSFLMSVLVLRTGQARYYVLAGLAAGLAASTKYNGAMILVSLLAAHCFVAWRKRTLVDISILAGLGSFGVGFLIGTPYALLDLPNFLKDFAFEIAHYRSGQPGFEGKGNLIWYVKTVLGSWDNVMLAFSLVGAIICLVKRRAPYYLLLVFPAIYFWWFSNFIVRFERNMVPLTPFMALLAAVFIDWLASKLGARLGSRSSLSIPAWALGFLALAVVPSVIGVVEFDKLLSGEHPKTIAAEWANSNLPPGSKIAVEHYGIPLNPDSFDLVNVLTLSNHDADWFVQQEFDYVVLSDGVWKRLFMEPEKYSAEVAAYKSIFERFQLVKEVELRPPSEMLLSYPTIEVYHLPTIRIYKVGGEAKQ